MTHDDAFLQAIREAPDDDAPRLLYADWLDERGDPRSEFIRLQCVRAGSGPVGPDAGRLAARAWRLLEGNWEAWVDPLRSLVGAGPSRREEAWLIGNSLDALVKFPRGFVADLAFDAAAFLTAPEEAFRLTALRVGRVWGAGSHAAALAASPRLGTLETLAFTDYFVDPLDAAGAKALTASPHLTHLRALLLGRNNVADAGAAALADAPWLMGLRLLDLTDNGLSTAGFWALAGSPFLSPDCVVRLGNNAVTTDDVGRAAREHGRSRAQFRL